MIGGNRSFLSVRAKVGGVGVRWKKSCVEIAERIYDDGSTAFLKTQHNSSTSAHDVTIIMYTYQPADG
jgi:hypothetical protein